MQGATRLTSKLKAGKPQLDGLALHVRAIQLCGHGRHLHLALPDLLVHRRCRQLPAPQQ